MSRRLYTIRPHRSPAGGACTRGAGVAPPIDPAPIARASDAKLRDWAAALQRGLADPRNAAVDPGWTAARADAQRVLELIRDEQARRAEPKAGHSNQSPRSRLANRKPA